MPLEKPCSPGHCLGMLNDHMRTDILRSVHEHIQAQRDQRRQRSPLDMLIKSIEAALRVFEGRTLLMGMGPNPFNADPCYHPAARGFQVEEAYHHDIALLHAQLGGLRELRAGMSRW